MYILNIWCINCLFTDGYSWIAVNTKLDCSLLGIGSSNKNKRKFAEYNNEKEEENNWVPIPKSSTVCKLYLRFKLNDYIANI